MPKTYAWTLLFGKAGDHRYFADYEGRIAVADDSGHFPHNTEDGVLYVDTTQPIIAPYERSDAFLVPLLDEAGKATRTFASTVEALTLSSFTGQPIATKDGLRFTVTKGA